MIGIEKNIVVLLDGKMRWTEFQGIPELIEIVFFCEISIANFETQASWKLVSRDSSKLWIMIQKRTLCHNKTWGNLLYCVSFFYPIREPPIFKNQHIQSQKKHPQENKSNHCWVFYPYRHFFGRTFRNFDNFVGFPDTKNIYQNTFHITHGRLKNIWFISFLKHLYCQGSMCFSCLSISEKGQTFDQNHQGTYTKNTKFIPIHRMNTTNGAINTNLKNYFLSIISPIFARIKIPTFTVGFFSPRGVRISEAYFTWNRFTASWVLLS